MTTVIIRIAMRWLAGALVTHGLFSADMTDLLVDPDLIALIEAGVGIIIGVAAEWWYGLARRFGWAT